MDLTDTDTESDTEYGTTELDDRGRLTVPKQLRDDLHLSGGIEFTIVREDGDIRLVRQRSDLETLTGGTEWGDEAFSDAGEATFGGR